MDTFTIKNLTFSYPEQAKKALDEISIRVPQGDFLTLCGPSGCGKSTLLRQLKPALTPHGTQSGEIFFEGNCLASLDHRTQSAQIGFVLQSPENQIVTDKVWHELAFGLESLGCDTPTIRQRVAEMASFFGIESWFYKNVTDLSGGQKQLLNLASVMAMHPSVLILDEPTSQLDPIAAADFLSTIGKINRELGTTVIVTEHRLEDVFPLSTNVIVMEQGRILCQGSANDVAIALKDSRHSMFLAMPAPMRIWSAVPNTLPCPITVRDGRHWLRTYSTMHELSELPKKALPAPHENAPAVTVKELWFKYEKDLPDVIKGLSFCAHRGELLTILGGNGTGKTTALSLLSGRRKPYRGTVQANGTMATLPQNPQALFVKKTVREDLLLMQKATAAISSVIKLCRLEELLDRHPYDLSGGEQQRAALAKILLLEPEILLLDEPTKGLDAEYKQIFAQILQSLLHRGVCIIMVSHDVEFCAKYAHRCAMFFDGMIVTEGEPTAFFSGNNFYTTSANRMARDLLPCAITAEDVILSCGGIVPPEPTLPDGIPLRFHPHENSAAAKPPKLRLRRKILAVVSAVAAIVCFVMASMTSNLTAHMGQGTKLILPAVFLAASFVFAFSTGRRSPRLPVPRTARKLPKRTLVSAVTVLLLVPLTLFVGVYYFDKRPYYVFALLIILEIMLPFVLVFEGRKPRARELVVVAVLCAIAIAGRGIFAAFPNFKPVTAIVIISGVAFGGETGFLVGAITMFASNMMFAQGAFTPFQMFAMGIIGFLAGALFRKGRRSRLSLSVFGALSAILIYGGIMNPLSALLWAQNITPKLLLTYYISGFPFDLIHAFSTFFFLFVASEPMLEKLDRIKIKYGLE